MSRLKELLDELCPDGVEYKKLGDIATGFFRGSGIKREQVIEKGTPCIRYGEIYTTYDIWFDTCISHVDESQLSSKKYFEYGDILFAITGEKVEDIAKSVAYMGHEKGLAGGDIVVMKHKQNPKYLSYALSTENAQRQKSKGRVKSKVVHSNVPAIKEIVIPVPPLAVQSEIVRLLDNFTALTAALTAELAARKTQYEHYRDTLLTFPAADEVADLSTPSVRWLRLGDICDLLTGFPFDSSQFTTSGIRLLRGMNIKRGVLDFTEKNNRYWSNSEGLEKYLLQEGDIVVAMDGSLVGKSYGVVKANELPLLLVQRVTRIRTDKANLRFIYHYIASGAFTAYVDKKMTAGAVPHISMRDIAKFQIPLPPREVQNKIVSILDRFDALCNDLSSGLPAEIEARRKQYEYYRDRLLTFREKRA